MPGPAVTDRWISTSERPRFNFGAILSSDDETETSAAWARLLSPESWASQAGRDPRYADLILYVEPGRSSASDVSLPG